MRSTCDHTHHRRQVSILTIAALLLAGCSSRIAGTPVAAVTGPLTTPPSSAAPTTPPSSAAPTNAAPTTEAPSTGTPPAETPESPSGTTPTSPSTAGVPPVGSPSPMLVKGQTIANAAVPSGPPVTVAMEFLPNSYDTLSDQGVVTLGEMAALTQPSVYLIDPLGHMALDTDVVTRVALRTDPQKIEYHINPKATWSDGVPVSCQDFYLAWLATTSKATIETAGSRVSAFGTYGDPDYDTIAAPTCSDGGRTVTVTASSPTPNWQNLFAGLLPAHVPAQQAHISDVTTIPATAKTGAVLKLATAYRTAFDKLDPAVNPSAGPYVLQSATESSIVLTRNPRWWGHPAGPEGIHLIAASDAAQAAQAVRNGRADVVSLTRQNIAVAVTLSSTGGITRTDQVLPVVDHLDFNLKDPLFTGKTGDALRQAVFSCVDRTAIAKAAAAPLDPRAAPLGNLLVQPWDPAYTDHYANDLTANVAKAKRLMRQGGWTLGQDGTFAHGTTKARFTLGVFPNPSRTAAAALVKKECAAAGIDIGVGNLDAVKLFDGKYQAAIFGWSAPGSPSGYAETYATRGSSNTLGYSNKKVDALFAQIASDLKPSDQSARLNEIDTIIAADHVSLPLFDETAVNLQANSIHTTVTNNQFWGGIVWDAYAWSVAG